MRALVINSLQDMKLFLILSCFAKTQSVCTELLRDLFPTPNPPFKRTVKMHEKACECARTIKSTMVSRTHRGQPRQTVAQITHRGKPCHLAKYQGRS